MGWGTCCRIQTLGLRARRQAPLRLSRLPFSRARCSQRAPAWPHIQIQLIQPPSRRTPAPGQPKVKDMPIIVNLDVMLARRKMRSKELSERIGITEQNVSLLKSGKVKGIRFETLERICEVLRCQPGDILEYRPDVSDEPQSSRAA
jgi:putative transcriptional regulator